MLHQASGWLAIQFAALALSLIRSGKLYCSPLTACCLHSSLQQLADAGRPSAASAGSWSSSTPQGQLPGSRTGARWPGQRWPHASAEHLGPTVVGPTWQRGAHPQGPTGAGCPAGTGGSRMLQPRGTHHDLVWLRCCVGSDEVAGAISRG
jgi:hypothetical protein